ncbi:MAG: hypothetical protein WA667_20670 [Candidatus Nitrosopolaris sp.]
MLAYDLYLRNKDSTANVPRGHEKPIKKIYVKKDQIITIDTKTLEYASKMSDKYRILQIPLIMPLNTSNSSFLNLPDARTSTKILSNAKGSQKMMKKNRLLEQLEEAGLVDKNLSGAAKHSRLKGLLNPISIDGGLDNPLVEVEYKGRQSNVFLTIQGESTLKIFGE